MDENLQKAYKLYMETSVARLPDDQKTAIENILDGVEPEMRLTPSLTRNLSARAQAIVRLVKTESRPYPEFNTQEYWNLVEEKKREWDRRFAPKIISRPASIFNFLGGQRSPEEKAGYFGDHHADED